MPEEKLTREEAERLEQEIELNHRARIRTVLEGFYDTKRADVKTLLVEAFFMAIEQWEKERKRRILELIGRGAIGSVILGLLTWLGWKGWTGK